MLTKNVLVVMIVTFCNSTLLGKMLVGAKFCSWSVKAEFSPNYVGFPL